jgi:hypothetical protein
MKSFFRIFPFILILLFLSFSEFTAAQEDPVSAESKKTGFGIRSLGISLGWYNPSMDYWNKEYFSDMKWENKFRGSMIYTGYLELNIIRNLRLKASGSYWTEKVSSGAIVMGVDNVPGTEQLVTSLTCISLDVIYRLGFLSFEKFSPYAGLGGSFVMVQNKFSRFPDGQDSEQFTNHGQDVTGTLLAGIERKFGEHFGAAIDFRYILGGYTQEMKDYSGNVTSHPVSLSGPQIGLNLSYIFR